MHKAIDISAILWLLKITLRCDILIFVSDNDTLICTFPFLGGIDKSMDS